MTTTEERVRVALHAKAAQVRPEQVDMPLPAVAPSRRRPHTALTLVAAVAVSTVLIAIWAIAAPTRGTGQQAASSGAGTSRGTDAGTGAGAATSAPIGSPPFQVPIGWSAARRFVTDGYRSWCVTDRGTGSDRCPGVTVYLASAGHALPLDDALVPACDAARPAQQRITPVTIDRRAASMISMQCTTTDPVWAIWRTGDGALAVVAEKGGAAYTTASQILADIHLPGAAPAASTAASAAPWSSDQPVPSTSSCPMPTRRPPPVADSPGAAGTAPPIPSTEPAAADDDCPTN